MSSRRARGDAAAPRVEQHPAATAAGLTAAVAIGFGTTLLLAGLNERDMP